MAYKVGRCLLQKHLDWKGMTQTELAEKLNVTPQQINKYTNNIQGMSLEVAGNISFILNIEIKHLYEWIEVGERE